MRDKCKEALMQVRAGHWNLADLETFVQVFIANEREACAKLAEETRHVVGADKATAAGIAAVIRERAA